MLDAVPREAGARPSRVSYGIRNLGLILNVVGKMWVVKGIIFYINHSSHKVEIERESPVSTPGD